MKVLVVFCVIAHLTIATPPFTNLLSGGLGSLLGSSGSDSGSTGGIFGGANPLSAVSGLIGGGTGQRTFGDVLGVKISLLSALQNAVNGGSQTIDVEGDGNVDGMGGGLGIEESSIGSSQSFAAGSGFSQMAGIGGSSSGGGYANAQQGYNYNRPAPVENTYLPPSSGNGHSGNGHSGNSNGGYVYNRPPPPSSYSSEGSSGFVQNDASFDASSASDYSSGSSSLESGSFVSSSNDHKITGGATQSGTAGLSGSSTNGIVGM